MAWITQVLQLVSEDGGEPSGKYHLTARSDEDGGGPFGDMDCLHKSTEDAQKCDRCNEYVDRITGFTSK